VFFAELFQDSVPEARFVAERFTSDLFSNGR